MRNSIMAASAVLCLSVAASAQQPSSRPPAFQKLVDCRSIADPAARLACYDREVAAVQQAQASQDLVVMDRAQVRTARRTLFGLPLPSLDFLGGGSKDKDGKRIEAEEEVKLEGTIKSFTRNASGRWLLVLDDGARWLQADSRELSADPRVGQPIVIRRAAMGSYLAKINGQIAIRVVRIL